MGEMIEFPATGHRTSGYETHYYDAGHAFFNDTRPPVYDKACAATAWERTLAFLRRHL
jgi:carboxymethylenebutenolidase